MDDAGESLGKTDVMDEPRQFGHPIEHAVIPACPQLASHRLHTCRPFQFASQRSAVRLNRLKIRHAPQNTSNT